MRGGGGGVQIQRSNRYFLFVSFSVRVNSVAAMGSTAFPCFDRLQLQEKQKGCQTVVSLCKISRKNDVCPFT